MTSRLTIGVVIATRNRSAILQKNIKKLSYAPIDELIVIDDSSSDNTHSVLKELSGIIRSKKIRFIYHRNDERMRTSRCWNLAIDIIRSDIIVILADDAIVQNTQSFSIIRRCFENNPKIGIVGGKVVERLSRDRPLNLYFLSDIFTRTTGFIFLDTGRKAHSAEFVPGVMAVRKEILKKARFDTTLSGSCYREESIFQQYAKNEGWSIFYEPKFVVIHEDLGVGGYRDYSMSECMYWKSYNHTYYLRKYFRNIKLIWYLIAGVCLQIIYAPWHIPHILFGLRDCLYEHSTNLEKRA